MAFKSVIVFTRVNVVVVVVFPLLHFPFIVDWSNGSCCGKQSATVQSVNVVCC